MSERAIFASDLHGNRYAYEQLFTTAAREGIRTVILGGDLTPKWPILRFFGADKALVPLDPRIFRPDKNDCTYDEFLQQTEERVGRKKTAAERHYTALGGYTIHTGVRLSWKQLRAEQAVLRRVLEEYERGSGAVQPRNSSKQLVLTHDEWVVLETLIRNSQIVSDTIDLEAILRVFRYNTLSEAHRQLAAKVFTDLHLYARKTVQSQPAEVRDYLQLKYPLANPAENTDGNEIISICRAVAGSHLLAQSLIKAREFDRAIEPQKTFLNQYLRRRVQRFKEEMPGSRVFLILGNDDMEECRSVTERMHDQGLIILISQRVVELNRGLQIAGYPYVRKSDGNFYDAWEKPEAEIARDLEELEREAGDPSRTIFVVHTPPSETQLDMTWGRRHFGSEGVRQWLKQSRKHLVLSGHVHEAPFINEGTWREEVEGTLCMQPGAWHDEGLCAIVFNLEDPTQAYWIHDQTKVYQGGAPPVP